jgi:ketosteroid isomerase-like protein
MTQDPAAIVRGMYEAFERGDIPDVLAFVHPDVEWVGR